MNRQNNNYCNTYVRSLLTTNSRSRVILLPGWADHAYQKCVEIIRMKRVIHHRQTAEKKCGWRLVFYSFTCHDFHNRVQLILQQMAATDFHFQSSAWIKAEFPCSLWLRGDNHKIRQVLVGYFIILLKLFTKWPDERHWDISSLMWKSGVVGWWPPISLNI